MSQKKSETIVCSNCGQDSGVSFPVQNFVNEFHCSKCGITYSLVWKEQENSQRSWPNRVYRDKKFVEQAAWFEGAD